MTPCAFCQKPFEPKRKYQLYCCSNCGNKGSAKTRIYGPKKAQKKKPRDPVFGMQALIDNLKPTTKGTE